MKKPSDSKSNKSNYRNKIIGLSESSTRKSYYPQLMKQVRDLEKREQQLEEQSEILRHTVRELQEAQESVKQSLKEKETLLREIHHRVKNNLQVISSLMGLQVQYMRDPYDAELLKDGQLRISAMALIHKKLYQSQDFTMIDIQSFLEEYLHYISIFYNISSSGILFNVTIDEIFLDIERAVPCGQIINELVTNSIKHAFPEKKGTIEVTMKQTADGKYLLSVSDDGIGIPDNIDVRNTKTLGMELIFVLSNQLDGEVTLERGAGTKITVVF